MSRFRKNNPLRLLSVGSALAAALAATALTGAPAAFAEPENGWHEVDGERYWYDDGVMATSKEVYDPETNAWYWFDADGTMAHDKDVYLPAGNKWVRYDSEGHMVKGEDFRYGGWYWFDPTTGEMLKGFVFVPSNGGKWVFYDYVTGQMAYGERYIDGANGDLPGWMYFDDVTGAVTYGWKDLPGKRVYYDLATGRMLLGWHEVEGQLRYFDEVTGAYVPDGDAPEPDLPQPDDPDPDPGHEAAADDVVVCVPKGDARYHYDWCPSLSRDMVLRYMTVADARDEGCEACPVCGAPV